MTEWSIPVSTQWMREQSHHEPSMQYAKDIYKVASSLIDFTALEIGCAWGFSTLAILEAGAKSLMSVDPNVLAKGEDEAVANGYRGKYAWTRTRSDVFWKENSHVQYDLIYVDGSHIYSDVKNDLYEAWERLNQRGLLLLDDWDHQNNNKVDVDGKTVMYGVSLACLEFWRDHKAEVNEFGIEGRVLWFEK